MDAQPFGTYGKVMNSVFNLTHFQRASDSLQGKSCTLKTQENVCNRKTDQTFQKLKTDVPPTHFVSFKNS